MAGCGGLMVWPNPLVTRRPRVPTDHPSDLASARSPTPEEVPGARVRTCDVCPFGFMNPLEIAGFVAAVLAGTGGCLLGVRAADAINRKLGRDAPPKDTAQEDAKAARDD
jgi:hypothetical protein